MNTISLTGLNPTQKHFADLVWSCDSQSELDQLKLQHPKFVNVIDLVVMLIALESIDQHLLANPNMSVAIDAINKCKHL